MNKHGNKLERQNTCQQTNRQGYNLTYLRVRLKKDIFDRSGFSAGPSSLLVTITKSSLLIEQHAFSLFKAVIANEEECFLLRFLCIFQGTKVHLQLCDRCSGLILPHTVKLWCVRQLVMCWYPTIAAAKETKKQLALGQFLQAQFQGSAQEEIPFIIRHQEAFPSQGNQGVNDKYCSQHTSKQVKAILKRPSK